MGHRDPWLNTPLTPLWGWIAIGIVIVAIVVIGLEVVDRIGQLM